MRPHRYTIIVFTNSYNWVLCCPVSVRTFSVMYDHSDTLCLQITRADIRPQVK